MTADPAQRRVVLCLLAMPMSVSAPSADEKTVDLKNRWLAGVLALLLPGLGHFYQGRSFKAGIYCVCILGLFFSGQALGEWKVVYLGDSDSGGRVAAGNGMVKRLLQGYAAQFPVGVLAWPAIIQSDRYHAEDDQDEQRARLEEPLEAPFHGGILVESASGPQVLAELAGTIRLEPPGSAATSTFVGALSDGTKVELPLGAVVELGKRVSAAETRTVATQLGPLPEAIEVPAGARPLFARLDPTALPRSLSGSVGKSGRGRSHREARRSS